MSTMSIMSAAANKKRKINDDDNELKKELEKLNELIETNKFPTKCGKRMNDVIIHAINIRVRWIEFIIAGRKIPIQNPSDEELLLKCGMYGGNIETWLKWERTWRFLKPPLSQRSSENEEFLSYPQILKLVEQVKQSVADERKKTKRPKEVVDKIVATKRKTKLTKLTERVIETKQRCLSYYKDIEAKYKNLKNEHVKLTKEVDERNSLLKSMGDETEIMVIEELPPLFLLANIVTLVKKSDVTSHILNLPAALADVEDNNAAALACDENQQVKENMKMKIVSDSLAYFD